MHNRKNEILAGVGILAVIVVVILLVGGPGKSPSQSSNIAESGTTTTNTMNQTSSTNGQSQQGVQMRTLPDGLQIGDETVGTGTEAVAGDVVTVNYVGTFANGTKFDASADHGGPFSFTLGGGNVIKGWDEGVAGMKVGGARKLVVPPSLGYGSQDYGPIPGNSTLIFEVQLLGVKSAQ